MLSSRAKRDAAVSLILKILRPPSGARHDDVARLPSHWAYWEREAFRNLLRIHQSMMYTPNVKRLQINIEEEWDDALAIEAAKRNTSKAALIREFVRERLQGLTPGPTKMDMLVGDILDEAGDIDDVVYRR